VGYNNTLLPEIKGKFTQVPVRGKDRIGMVKKGKLKDRTSASSPRLPEIPGPGCQTPPSPGVFYVKTW
jgi:hypothetical protein